MFYCSRNHDTAIAQIHKAGSQTFNEWLRWGICDNEGARQFSKRVAFIRHPLERLKSAYSMWHYYTHGAYQGDWHTLIDRILDESFENEHFMPQVKVVEDVPNIYHKFENLEQHWEKYRRGILPWMNKCSRAPDIDDYRHGELLDYYAEDLILWEASDGT